MDDFIVQARDVARRLGELDLRCEAFGAKKHAYRFFPPASEEQVAAFELEHGVVLPADFRAFVTRLGNGGVGPFYGVGPLPKSAPECSRVFTGVVEDDEPLSGALVVGEYGCGIFVVLVVNGPDVGQIWWDARYEAAGITPIRDPAGMPMTFATWWLSSLRSVLDRFETVARLMRERVPHDVIHERMGRRTLSLDVDRAIISIADASPGKPSQVRKGPWGVDCGQADDVYDAWLRRHPA